MLASALAASETVTVGGGGAGGTTGTGSTGGTSSLGGHCSANGGEGGLRHNAVPPPTAGAGATGSTTGTGDLIIPGGATEAVHLPAATYVFSPNGGNSHLGSGAVGIKPATGAPGNPGLAYGGGGSGGANIQSQGTSKNGGAGAVGLVIVDLYF